MQNQKSSVYRFISIIGGKTSTNRTVPSLIKTENQYWLPTKKASKVCIIFFQIPLVKQILTRSTTAQPVGGNDWLKATGQHHHVKWLLRKISNFALQTFKNTGYLSCPKFHPTEIINQLIDNCVRPELYFASSIINNIIGNLAIKTESTQKRVNSGRVLHIYD